MNWQEYYEQNVELVEKNCPELIVYDAKIDYVGPNKRRVIAWLVPNTIYGVNINECGFNHDRRYQIGGTEDDRIKADKLFFTDIITKLESSYLSKSRFLMMLARRRAYKYYVAVLLGGNRCFNYKDNT